MWKSVDISIRLFRVPTAEGLRIPLINMTLARVWTHEADCGMFYRVISSMRLSSKRSFSDNSMKQSLSMQI